MTSQIRLFESFLLLYTAFVVAEKLDSGYRFYVLNIFLARLGYFLLMIALEVKGMIVGIALCIIGLVAFVYGTNNITFLNAVSNMFLTVIGIFMLMAGLLVLVTNLFSKGSVFT